jgi:hypothetical protein
MLGCYAGTKPSTAAAASIAENRAFFRQFHETGNFASPRHPHFSSITHSTLNCAHTSTTASNHEDKPI